MKTMLGANYSQRPRDSAGIARDGWAVLGHQAEVGWARRCGSACAPGWPGPDIHGPDSGCAISPCARNDSVSLDERLDASRSASSGMGYTSLLSVALPFL